MLINNNELCNTKKNSQEGNMINFSEIGLEKYCLYRD